MKDNQCNMIILCMYCIELGIAYIVNLIYMLKQDSYFRMCCSLSGNLLKSKTFSLINIIGLASGLACFILSNVAGFLPHCLLKWI